MRSSTDRSTRVIDVLAGLVATLVAVSFPLVFFALSYQNQDGSMEAEAEIHARVIADVIRADPAKWRREGARLTDLLAQRPSRKHPEIRIVTDDGNHVIARSGEELVGPTFSHSETLVDAGAVVGRIEIRRSLLPLIGDTGLTAALGFLLGVSIFVVLRVLPLRALRKALEALSREKERAQVTLHSIGDGVIVVGVSGRVETLNEVAQKLTGWKEEAAAGRPLEEVFQIVDGKTRERCPNPFDKVCGLPVPGGKPPLSGGCHPPPGEDPPPEAGAPHTSRRIVLISRDGVERLVEKNTSPILHRDGLFAGAVLVFRDVTERVRAEDELVKGKKLESLGILAGGIAHDFNNYLAGILGNLSLAKLTVEPEHRAYQRLEGAEKASLRAKELAHKLLTFSKGGKPVKDPVSLEEILRDSGSLATMGSNCRCEYSIREGLWPVIADGGQVGQVVSNLVINAIQAMPEGGVIRIRADNAAVGNGEIRYVKAGNYVMFEVADQGIGIPAENLQKIFDPFFTTKEKGSGLGLATSYNVMKGHGGNIFVESEAGAGTTFRMYLPAMKDLALQAGKTEGGKAVRGKGRVLVMDDEELLLDVAGGMLEHLGYEPDFAKEGAEAIGKYIKAAESRKPYDVVIMDLTIPGGMGGKEAAARLLELYPDAKVIVTSGYSNDPVMAQFTEYGFLGCIAKPYRIVEISRVLHEIVTGGEELPAGTG